MPMKMKYIAYIIIMCSEVTAFLCFSASLTDAISDAVDSMVLAMSPPEA